MAYYEARLGATGLEAPLQAVHAIEKLGAPPPGASASTVAAVSRFKADYGGRLTDYDELKGLASDCSEMVDALAEEVDLPGSATPTQ